MIPKKNLSNRLKEKPYIRIVYVAIVASVLLLAGLNVMLEPIQAKHKTMSGTGTISVTLISRVETPLTPSCYVHIQRVTAITYTGFIEGTGQRQVDLITNRCVSPPKSHGSLIETLDEVTIEGRKGSIVITQDFNLDGDSRVEPIVARGWAKIVSGSGGLGGITGRGVVAMTTDPASSSTVYWFEVEFDQG